MNLTVKQENDMVSEVSEFFTELRGFFGKKRGPELVTGKRGKYGEAEVLVYPKDMEVWDLKSILDQYKEKPDFRTGTHFLDDQDSLIAMINRFKAEQSVLIAHGEIAGTTVKAWLRAIFDFHPQGGDNAAAAFGNHKAEYQFPISKEFEYWIAKSGQLHAQPDFCTLIESRLADLVDGKPSDTDVSFGVEEPVFAGAAKMLELSRGLEVRSDEKIHQTFRSNSGEMKVQYTSEHKDNDGQPLTIPKWFMIQVPIFLGEELTFVPCRLLYRIDNTTKTLKFGYELYRVEEVFESNFQAACKAVQEATQVPLFFGKGQV